MGLKAVGCLGIITKAYKNKKILKHEALECVQKLVDSGLWVSPDVLSEIFSSFNGSLE